MAFVRFPSWHRICHLCAAHHRGNGRTGIEVPGTARAVGGTAALPASIPWKNPLSPKATSLAQSTCSTGSVPSAVAQVRMLAASLPVANAIARELKRGGAGASAAAARRAYQALWPAKARLQRDFHVFGGEFLMEQGAPILRGFFDGFFKIPLPLWAVRRLELVTERWRDRAEMILTNERRRREY